MTRYVTLSDIAAATGNSLPIVSNWRRRYADSFPQPSGGGRANTPLFAEDEVLSFLSDRANTRTKMNWDPAQLSRASLAANSLWRGPGPTASAADIRAVILAADLLASSLLARRSPHQTLDRHRTVIEQLHEAGAADGNARDQFRAHETALDVLSSGTLSEALRAERDLPPGPGTPRIPFNLFDTLQSLRSEKPELAAEVWEVLSRPLVSDHKTSCVFGELLTPAHLRSKAGSDAWSMMAQALFRAVPEWEEGHLYFHGYGSGDLFPHVFPGAADPGPGRGASHVGWSIDGWDPDPENLLLASHRLWHARICVQTTHLDDPTGELAGEGRLALSVRNPTLTAGSNSAPGRLVHPTPDVVVQVSTYPSADPLADMVTSLALLPPPNVPGPAAKYVVAVTDFSALNQPGPAADLRSGLVASGALVGVLSLRPVNDPEAPELAKGRVVWILRRVAEIPFESPAGVFIGTALHWEGGWHTDQLGAVFDAWRDGNGITEPLMATEVPRATLIEAGANLNPQRWVQLTRTPTEQDLRRSLARARKVLKQPNAGLPQTPRITLLKTRQFIDVDSDPRVDTTAVAAVPARWRHWGIGHPDEVSAVTSDDVLARRFTSHQVVELGEADRNRLTRPGDILVAVTEDGDLFTWISPGDHAVTEDVVVIRAKDPVATPPRLLAALLQFAPYGDPRHPRSSLVLPDLPAPTFTQLSQVVGRVIDACEQRQRQLEVLQEALSTLGDIAPYLGAIHAGTAE